MFVNDVGNSGAVNGADNQPVETPVNAPQQTGNALRDTVARAFASVDATPEPQQPFQPQQGGVPRDPQGRFAPRQQEQQAQPQLQQPTEQLTEQPQGQSPDLPAPSVFSEEAKASWATVPDPVKQDFYRYAEQAGQVVSQYREVLEPLQPFFELAQQHNVTVHETMANYVNMERLLVQDPVQGVAMIAQNLGIDPTALAQALLGGAQTQQPNDQTQQYYQQLEQRNQALEQRLAELDKKLNGVTTTIETQQQRAVASAYERFAADKPRLKEPKFEKDVAFFIETGRATGKNVTEMLQSAYEMAERLNPDPSAQSQQSAPPRVPVSISGTPNPGQSPTVSGAPGPLPPARQTVAKYFG